YELANALGVNRYENSRCAGALPDGWADSGHRETKALHVSRTRPGKPSGYGCVLNVRARAIFREGYCHPKVAVDYGARCRGIFSLPNPGRNIRRTVSARRTRTSRARYFEH